MKIKITKNPKGYDHDRVEWVGVRGFGYRGKGKKKICVERCPVCGNENYGPVVATGKCYFCGFDPNKKEAK